MERTPDINVILLDDLLGLSAVGCEALCSVYRVVASRLLLPVLRA